MSSDVARFLRRRDVRASILTGNGIWHFCAWYYFTKRGRGVVRNLTGHKDNPVAVDMLAYLGAINLGYVALAAYRLKQLFARPKPKDEEAELELDRSAFLTLGVANLSQYWLDIFALRLFDGRLRLQGVTGKTITYVDGLFTFVDFGWLLLAR